MKRVLLTQRAMTTDKGETRDCLDQAWSALLEGCGALPIPIPGSLARPESYLEALEPDLLLLTGGGDLATIKDAIAPCPTRDRLEHKLVEWCASHSLPVIGVCRGMQVLVDMYGGVLCPVDGHIAQRHRILVDESPLSPGGWKEVNSYHRLAVSGPDLPSPLTPLAWDDAGNVEAFITPDLLQVGLMWHPEREALNRWGVTIFHELLARLLQSPRVEVAR